MQVAHSFACSARPAPAPRSASVRPERGGGGRQVAEDDADEQVDAQWKALCAAVARADTALVMHMPDHYSLVHAVRQWTVENRARRAVPARPARPHRWDSVRGSHVLPMCCRMRLNA